MRSSYKANIAVQVEVSPTQASCGGGGFAYCLERWASSLLVPALSCSDYGIRMEQF